MNIFNIYEVAGMGVEKEKKRRDFYARVAKLFKEGELNRLFSQLRDWEEVHVAKFTEIQNSLKEESSAQSYEGELKSYMDSFIDDRLYRDVSAEEFSKRIKTPIDAVNHGIEFEKDAILFFTGIMPYITGANKEVILKLIDEERQHIIYLVELKKKISG